MSHAIYPGSFDPITMGHVDIIQRIRAQFERVTVLIAISPRKSYLFTPEERKKLVEQSLGSLTGISVELCSGLTVDYMRRVKATTLIRGLRTFNDFDSEMAMAHINKKLYPEVETLLVFAAPEYQAISSTLVKEAAMFGAQLKGLIPPSVEQALQNKFMSK